MRRPFAPPDPVDGELSARTLSCLTQRLGEDSP
jgi:hypothetical protein